MNFSIATWNVNSVKQRLPQLLDWLKRDKPDIVLLQETKCTDDSFPAMEIEDCGYNLALHGEKTYNGVAILSKFPLEDIRKGLPGLPMPERSWTLSTPSGISSGFAQAGDDADAQARYVEAVVSVPSLREAIRVASVYIPNGQDAQSSKFPYKLRFLDRFCSHVKTLLPYEEMLIIGGDYNIAPEDADVHDQKLWQGSVLTHDEVRQRLRKILHSGVYDAYRLLHTKENEYSWWDYRANAFAQDNGLRIDHLLLSPQAADKLKTCVIEKEMRGVEKASDHTPVIASFAQ